MYETIIDDIRKDHIDAAQDYFSRYETPRSKRILAKYNRDVEDVCADLVGFLAATQRVGEISTRSKDTVISKGEILSCHFMTAVLRNEGVDAELIDLSNVVFIKSDPFLVKAPEGTGQDFYNALAKAIGSKLSMRGVQVPVITGYFGVVPGGLLNQVGRGYTDLCAALCAVGLQATELQIWKEVDGIYTADPRVVPTAKLIPSITPEEASELTFYGSEVIHSFTMHQAVSAQIPLRIRNVTKPLGPGTKIVPEVIVPILDGVASEQQTPRGSLINFRPHSSSSRHNPAIRAKRPTAVTIKHNILVMNVHSNKRSLAHGFFAKIFSTLDKWRLSVDLISTSEVHVSMALHSESAFVDGKETNKRVVDADLHNSLEELKQVGEIELLDGMAILSLVGREMKNMTGIAGRMFSVLGENNVNIEMISQGKRVSLQCTRMFHVNLGSGASEINISCVIEGRDADRAMSILHTNLFTFLDDSSY